MTTGRVIRVLAALLLAGSAMLAAAQSPASSAHWPKRKLTSASNSNPRRLASARNASSAWSSRFSSNSA